MGADLYYLRGELCPHGNYKQWRGDSRECKQCIAERKREEQHAADMKRLVELTWLRKVRANIECLEEWQQIMLRLKEWTDNDTT
jgi:hypothetical protein